MTTRTARRVFLVLLVITADAWASGGARLEPAEPKWGEELRFEYDADSVGLQPGLAETGTLQAFLVFEDGRTEEFSREMTAAEGQFSHTMTVPEGLSGVRFHFQSSASDEATELRASCRRRNGARARRVLDIRIFKSSRTTCGSSRRRSLSIRTTPRFGEPLDLVTPPFLPTRKSSLNPPPNF